ncbi:hypothetical protein [Xanthomonas sp. XNM01]|uniref:hypothetical protein n=1 Tax=Xanthomonas sp. XNM01 TaxID=2769289 RepID=UPI00177B35F4|nr:hypothetical protein [Xanthomonas sp. XNM01]MBD9370064.1 hypothetical protein [Xanthomonas sp. XNM01]
MRNLDMVEIEEVSGGFRVVGGLAALAAWAFEKREALYEIGQAAVAKHEALNAEH